MAFSGQQLRRLNDDYAALTGKTVQRFVCPITLKDEQDAELCDGHILNASIKKAARKTIVQRTDVDNYFGQTLEPDLVAFLNARVSSFKEMVKRACELTVTLPSSEKVSAFFANSKARGRFPQVDLLDSSGNVIASPFLRTRSLEPKLHKDLKVEWLMVFTDSALMGSMIKSAYLALFHIMGYRYVLSPYGDCVRKSLAGFYEDNADKYGSAAYFSKFKGSIKFMLNNIPDDACNTVDDGLLWFHYQIDDPDPGRRSLFAVSCLFKMNDRVITVRVPACLDGRSFEAAYSYYEASLTDANLDHETRYAQLVGDEMHVSQQPISVRYAP
jgi:hypothetical protein